MVLTQSANLDAGSTAKAFSLPDTRNGQQVSLDQFANQPLLVAFICNHCPYVLHLIDELVSAADSFAELGVATVAISANDAQRYPDDSPENMARFAAARGFTFPYCFDDTQATARDYGAVCTPDLYLYDQHHHLFYHGQFDSSRPGNGNAHGTDLKQAVTAMLAGQAPAEQVTPSVGCSIKWKS